MPPLDVYNRPANLFVADFVGNPSINFVEAKGKEQADGSFSFRILDDLEATFRPNEPIDMAAWFAKRDKDAADLEAQRIEMLKDKKAVEKSNKDEVFKYHIAKVDESDYAVEEEPGDHQWRLRPGDPSGGTEALRGRRDRIHDLRCNADWYGIYREAQDRKVPADRRDLRRCYL